MATDKLFWRLFTTANIAEAKAEKNINDFILAELNSLQISPIFLDKLAFILVNDYSDDSQKIATSLTILR